MAVTVYTSFIGQHAASVRTSSLWNSTQVTWIREADLSTFEEAEPEDADYASVTAGSVAGMAAALTAQGIATTDTRWIMYDMETYPPTWYYTDGGTGNGVTWSEGHDTTLIAATYKAKTQTAIEARIDGCYAHAAGAEFGEHLIPNRLTWGYGKGAGNDDEADTDWAGALADMAWLGTKLAAKTSRLFCWLYVIYNIGDDDGSTTATAEEMTNWVTNSVSYYRAAATSLGLNPDQNVYYTWHYAVGNVTRPTQETLETMYAALVATGLTIHWVVAMGSVTTAAQAAGANVYLDSVVIPALGGTSTSSGTGYFAAVPRGAWGGRRR